MPKRYLKPTLTDIDKERMQRVVDKLYDDLNDLADVMVKPKDETASRTGGNTGEVRAINDRGDNSVVLQVRTPKGWIEIARKELQ